MPPEAVGQSAPGLSAQPARPSWPARIVGAIDPLAFVLPLGILVAWTGMYVFEVMPRVLLPSPWDVLRTIGEWINPDWARGRPAYFTGTWLNDALGSAYRALVGFVIGAAAAVALGVWVGWSRTAERFFDPTVQLLRPMPRTALLPFAIIFFGLTNASALFLVIYGVFLQVYVQVVTGVKLVGRDWKRAAAMLGASPRQVLWRVVLPGALPHIFGGLRLGVAYAWTLMILAEMFAVSGGFGYILWRGYEFMRMDIVLGGMLMLGIFGFLSDRVIVLIGRRKLAWAQDMAGNRL
ncbi:ABC transporter permease [Falsiroseomonas oryzae]|uniref:ABC transporter permease n=1 Tax=Falsiroseomonas oryzae TaxID=2766473 RepID=UPI0022EAC451|nr:ABC transporter permease [Roseomonas sp. MO-31]